jgi:UDP-glucose 4-epimerase
MINRTVIVTGAAGYIGGAISIELHRQGYYVIGVDRRPLPDHLTKYFKNFVQDEFNGPKSKLELLSLPAAIVHCAGTSLVGPSVKNPEEYYDNNVSKTLKYITDVRRYSPTSKFIFSSSASVYGAPETPIALTENSNTNPISPYGETKLMTEMMLKSFSKAYGFKYVSFRYFNACGAVANGLHGQEPEATHIFARLFESIKTNTPFYLYGTDYNTSDGTCVRDYIHVTDIAKAHISAIEHSIEGIYNIGSRAQQHTDVAGHSNLSIIKAVGRYFGKNLSVEVVNKREGDPAFLIANSSKLYKDVNWQPENTLDNIIKDLDDWYSSDNYAKRTKAFNPL